MLELQLKQLSKAKVCDRVLKCQCACGENMKVSCVHSNTCSLQSDIEASLQQILNPIPTQSPSEARQAELATPAGAL